MKFVILLGIVAIMAVVADASPVPGVDEIQETAASWWASFKSHASAAGGTLLHYGGKISDKASKGLSHVGGLISDAASDVAKTYTGQLGDAE